MGECEFNLAREIVGLIKGVGALAFSAFVAWGFYRFMKDIP